MRELVVKYKAEKVCHEKMVKMPLVDLKVLEDVSFRICMDYRKLSEIAIRNCCHQIRVHEEEIPKTDFRTRYGHFEFTVMPFGSTRNQRRSTSHEDEFGAAEEREVLREAQQGQSGVKRKFFRSFRNKMGNELILALREGSDNFVLMREARAWWFCLRMLEALGVQDEECDLDGSRASTTHFQSEGLNMRKGGVKPRCVRDICRTIQAEISEKMTLIMEEAHATKYSVRPGVSKM
nr:putative reverse transcriptase domain, ribonuclease H-like domain, aspartic peptidase domain protein [Tanacetum cinerariifolium]